MNKWLYTAVLLLLGAALATFLLSATVQGAQVVETVGNAGLSLGRGLITLGLGAVLFTLPLVLGWQFRGRVVPLLDQLIAPEKPFSFLEILLIGIVFGVAAGGLQLLALQLANTNVQLAVFLSTFGTGGWLTLGPISGMGWFFYGFALFGLSYLLRGKR